MMQNSKHEARNLGFQILVALFSFALLTCSSYARLEIVQPQLEPFVFSGKGRQIEVVVYNESDRDAETEVSTRIYQATSATLAPIGQVLQWKKLRMFAGQKVIERASLDFPDVRAMTVFQIRWLTDGDKEIGRTTVHVVPTNILGQISVLASNQVIGLIDSGSMLKPVLRQSRVKFEEVESLADFSGNLALIGPSGEPEGIASSLKAQAKHPITVLWIRRPTSPSEAVPNLYFVEIGQARVAVADAQLFADLDKSALAQINLLRCVRVALHPQELKLPGVPEP
jgi:hypothetical protein